MIYIYIVLAIIVVYIIAVYNGLVTLRNHSEEAWADIGVQLKRRYDLIPNLINTVKGYATHESTVFEKVTEARAKAMSASGTPTRAAAEGELANSLKSVFAIAEAYPQLKANENFLALQTELSDTENKIQAARRFYNANVRDYTIKLQTFPTNAVASLGHFEKKSYFDIPGDDAAQQPVEVKF